jgi:aminoglycoside 3-N-acetyltransferase
VAKTITDYEFETALRNVIDPDDDVIVIYSAIWSFAHRLGGSSDEVTARVFDIIDSVVGKERTVLFPTFTNTFVKTRSFDLSLDDSDCSGILANYAMHSPGFRRTRQPIHSYTVRGPKADEVLARPCTTAWGDDSVIAWMGEANARFCPLGLPWHFACSFYHRIEEVLQVPYRYYKRFAGTLLDNGQKIGNCAEVKYCYSLQVPPKFDHTKIAPIMDQSGFIRKNGNPLIPLQSATGSDIYRVTQDFLGEDLYGYVTNKEEVKAWVDKGMAEEIEALDADERWPTN